MSARAQFVIEKAISLPLIAAAILFLSPNQVLIAFIVFGMGHIVIAYLYQYRAKKYVRAYAGLGATALVIGLMVLLGFRQIEVLIVATGIAFLTHFLQDELFLSGNKPSFLRTLEMAPVWLLYTGTLLNTVMHIHVLFQFGLLAIALVAVYAILMARARKIPDALSIYFLSITALLLYLSLFEIFVPLQTLIGTLVLLHYSGWYIAYYFKVRANPDRLRSYLVSVLVVNAIVFTLYWFFLSIGTRSWLAYLFIPVYFYVWTLVHTVFSLRMSDWKNSFAPVSE